ncbi:beta-ketoacyl synthase N-terminal-like domain-containing protein [Nocardia yamanashiensis]|uniref:beta-ketoacyl synthase N-terminal-like domain-containing protein n=1 Tax=Nocardia yamanashiensis TaxID=209247 RepID=UPI00083393C3|nr:beta-ketoacyl synthase N-terminal-like domain-containing protein [Nocardia yamanashiensis]
MRDQFPNQPIAIIGMATRLPDAPDHKTLWRNLLAGVESVRRFDRDELLAAGVPAALADNPQYVPAGTELAGIDQFDAGFFGFTPYEAKITDPQHRVLLQTAWEALEDAAIVASGNSARIGVFAATTLSTYLLNNIQRNARYRVEDLNYPILIGNDKDFLATRIAFKLGLRGAAVTVQSACSSSMVAIHQAVTSLRNGDNDITLAGGVSVVNPQTAGYLYQEGGIGARDGHCRPFDRDAGGTVRGNGCGVVVLKRLADALADNDNVYAVLAGTAVNNDGSNKIGFTAPSVTGQAEVIREALAAASVAANTIGYVETHGTGTTLGDPIEFRALSRAHADAPGGAPRTCLLGSIKANIGHLDAAAGVVGLIKTALVLHHQVVPPQINFTEPNPQVRLDGSGYAINTAPFSPQQPLLAAGVSSFGLGGTNTHAVLVRHTPAPDDRPQPSGSHRIVLSARSAAALARGAARLAAHLRSEAVRIDDLAWTLRTGRKSFTETLAFDAETSGEVADILERFGAGELPAPVGTDTDPVPAHRISLPAYSFDTDSYWIAPDGPVVTEQVRSDPPRTASAGADDIDGFVLDTVRNLLEDNSIELDTDFYDAGGESIAMVDLVTTARDHFDVQFDFEGFEGLRTLRAMANHLRAVIDGTAQALGTVTIHEGAGTPLFLVPPAGGTNFGYSRLASHLADSGPMIAFTAPPHGEVTTIRELARRNVNELKRIQPEGPYRLGGYSFGGNVALEMALQLQADGQRVTELYLFDSHAPLAYLGDELSESEFLTALPQMISAAIPGLTIAPGRTADSLAELPGLLDARPDWLNISDADITGFARTWWQNHNALKGYYPDSRFAGRCVIFDAIEAHPEEELATLRIRLTGKDAWYAHLAGEVEIVPVPGNHYTMFTDAALVPILAKALARATTSV